MAECSCDSPTTVHDFACPLSGRTPRDRRFRDMSLTEEEVRAIVLERGCFLSSLPKREKRLAKAKRLLPLWRQWGLRDLRNEGFNDGWNTYRDTH